MFVGKGTRYGNHLTNAIGRFVSKHGHFCQSAECMYVLEWFRLKRGEAHGHEQTIESGWNSYVFVGTSLVDMYAKCGCLENVQQDAISKCGDLDHHGVGRCEMWQVQKALAPFDK